MQIVSLPFKDSKACHDIGKKLTFIVPTDSDTLLSDSCLDLPLFGFKAKVKKVLKIPWC